MKYINLGDFVILGCISQNTYHCFTGLSVISCPLKSNLLWCCHGCAVRLDHQQAASLTHTATLRLLLLQAFTSPFCPLFNSKDYETATCSLLVLLQSTTQSVFKSNHHQDMDMYKNPNQVVPLFFVVKIWSQAQWKGTQDKTLKSVSGHRLALTKQGSKQQELRQWGFERGPT